jgi:hypothetical protein
MGGGGGMKFAAANLMNCNPAIEETTNRTMNKIRRDVVGEFFRKFNQLSSKI